MPSLVLAAIELQAVGVQGGLATANGRVTRSRFMQSAGVRSSLSAQVGEMLSKGRRADSVKSVFPLSQYHEEICFADFRPC